MTVSILDVGYPGGALYALSQLPSPGTSPYMPATRPRMTTGLKKSHDFQRDEAWRVTY